MTPGVTGDDVQIDDDFEQYTVSEVTYDWEDLKLDYDEDGNLTDDRIYFYVYDAWNRLVKVTRREDQQDAVATYSYDGRHRRIKKVVTKSGEYVVNGSDAGGITLDTPWLAWRACLHTNADFARRGVSSRGRRPVTIVAVKCYVSGRPSVATSCRKTGPLRDGFSPGREGSTAPEHPRGA